MEPRKQIGSCTTSLKRLRPKRVRIQNGTKNLRHHKEHDGTSPRNAIPHLRPIHTKKWSCFRYEEDNVFYAGVIVLYKRRLQTH